MFLVLDFDDWLLVCGCYCSGVGVATVPDRIRHDCEQRNRVRTEKTMMPIQCMVSFWPSVWFRPSPSLSLCAFVRVSGLRRCGSIARPIGLSTTSADTHTKETIHTNRPYHPRPAVVSPLLSSPLSLCVVCHGLICVCRLLFSIRHSLLRKRKDRRRGEEKKKEHEETTKKTPTSTQTSCVDSYILSLGVCYGRVCVSVLVGVGGSFAREKDEKTVRNERKDGGREK